MPIFKRNEATEHNTAGYKFYWLFFKLWTLDAAGFEFSLVMDNHWGVGVIGVLPYLRWIACIPCPQKVADWVQRNFWRSPYKR